MVMANGKEREPLSWKRKQIESLRTLTRQSAGAGFLKENEMKYEVRVGINEVLAFHFDNLGDAVDFVFTCVENGYRATVVPMEGEVDDGE